MSTKPPKLKSHSTGLPDGIIVLYCTCCFWRLRTGSACFCFCWVSVRGLCLKCKKKKSSFHYDRLTSGTQMQEQLWDIPLSKSSLTIQFLLFLSRLDSKDLFVCFLFFSLNSTLLCFHIKCFNKLNVVFFAVESIFLLALFRLLSSNQHELSWLTRHHDNAALLELVVIVI